MFAIRPDRTGGPDVLTLTEHPTPTPGPDEVLVRSEAIGVNFIDVYHRRGLYPLPFADGATFGLPAVETLSAAIRSASAVLLAAPVYNFDLNAAAKNLIEHTGKAWEDKVVGFLLAAGAQRSYMAAQAFAGSLALDFRSLVVPRFVYAVREEVSPDRILSEDIARRVAELVQATARLAGALAPAASTAP